jgi:hypothetical protein
MDVNMDTPVNNQIAIQETYNDIAFLSKLASLENCPYIHPDQVLYAKRLIARLYGGRTTNVKYARKVYKITDSINESIGRFWPLNTAYHCYQNMFHSLRHILLNNEFSEMDMVNAHAMLLSGFYPDAQHIARYISEREKILLEIKNTAGVNQWSAKNLIIILLFGGSVNSWKLANNVSADVSLPPFVRDLEEEIRILQARFLCDPANTKYCIAAKDKRKHSKKPWENSAFALWLQDLESKCMQACMEYCTINKIPFSSLIHDSLLIKKILSHLINLEDISAFVREKTGLKCSFSMKPKDITEEDIEWKNMVLKHYDDRQNSIREAELLRDDFC